MKKWITDRPYLVTSAIFLVIIVFGWLFLYWQEEDYAFVLLLYLIVTLGIRMDDISRKIGGVTGRQPAGSEDKDTIISRLNDIQTNLIRLNATLNLLAKSKCKEDAESTKNQ